MSVFLGATKSNASLINRIKILISQYPKMDEVAFDNKMNKITAEVEKKVNFTSIDEGYMIKATLPEILRYYIKKLK
jgi:hypothetical protein